ncbi:hypothetical protein CMQ_6228 [Grosmannia clavigera kw1407]|uniref:Pre-mRNA splicing factor n=1 Tax=Grosmannia clavigera (strain kw1407 / UAMH 11150) TaxID=655863 RepID=F0XLN9_GROCL|nr:uncharacterized protein CMQ_6228 [Grosmannia clavigera kw1407]EFX01286.1 hypothetical protein CMQ_6228 [Grosmannia clavigera kw1407]
MTRIAVYGTALVTFTAATAMTIAANLVPRWVVYAVPPTPGSGAQPFWQTLGLHRSCSSEAVPSCRPFPQTSRDCSAGAGQQYFCSVWRSVGFMMALALVVELAALVGFVVVMAGGRLKRESGWRVLGLLLAAAALLHVFAGATVAFLRDRDDRFLVPGWRLDISWIFCIASATIAFLCAAGLALSALVLPPEDGYEFLRDPVES